MSGNSANIQGVETSIISVLGGNLVSFYSPPSRKLAGLDTQPLPPREAFSLSTYTFRDRSLLEMEQEIVGACIENSDALRWALACLEVDDFRSQEAAYLRQVFYVLAGWLSKGTWDDATNRDRLDAYGLANEHLWSPLAMIPGYIEALCDAITTANQLDDLTVAAVRLRDDTYPISRTNGPAPRPPVRATPPPKERRHYGGIDV